MDFYKPKFFPCIVNLFIHPLCALSAFESLSCSQAAILRDLRKGPGWSCDRVCLLGHTLPRMALSSFFISNAAYRYSVRPSKWNVCCTGSGKRLAMRPGDHTWWANHVLHYSALDSPLDGPSEALFRPWVLWVGQPVWALTQDPQYHLHSFCSQISQSSFIVTLCSLL